MTGDHEVQFATNVDAIIYFKAIAFEYYFLILKLEWKEGRVKKIKCKFFCF